MTPRSDTENRRTARAATRSGRVRRQLAAVVACGLLAVGCSKAGTAGTASDGSGGDAPVKVGLVYSKTGPLAAYGKQYIEGFRAGLDYATKGTGKVDGHRVELSVQDDAGDPAKAVSEAKDLIGKGCTILAGSTSSGVALQVAPVAAQNKVLFISGPAAADKITGLNRYTFRSGRQSYQDIRTAAAFIGRDANGSKVTVLAQDSAFGQANVAAVKAVLGKEGATVKSVLAPPSATDLTPFAKQAKSSKPDLLFVAWAGDTASALWTSLTQQDVFSSTKVVTGLDLAASYPLFGPAATRISFLNHYFDGAAQTDVERAMTDAVQKAGSTPDIFTPDGFTAAQMIVHAVQTAKGADDTSAMVKALEGWSFDGVKGRLTVRAEDHALLQPMFQVKLTGSDKSPKPAVVQTLPADEVAPPVAPMAG
ncbi:substrate-binding domain-containing protein [Streptomyces sp. MS06]|uniref:substrate-binding domain-containing protein n=1 Tax=Streptomyces sp. MS06 TaxID=3385974 RepID=UPI0039A2802E